jgi:type II secretory pathway pseudopilin PulG
MTLVELLLVLALLVIIGSIIVPVFTGSFASVRLRRAGDQVLTRWAQTRARAIETGEVYQFRFTVDSGNFQIERWLPMEESEEGPLSSRTTTASDASGGEAATTDDLGAPIEAALPEEIVFQGGQIAVEDAAADKEQVQSLEARGSAASTPILFFPDGTTSEASLVLANNRQQYVRLSLRGLTGVGRATSILSRDELQRYSRAR